MTDPAEAKALTPQDLSRWREEHRAFVSVRHECGVMCQRFWAMADEVERLWKLIEKSGK